MNPSKKTTKNSATNISNKFALTIKLKVFLFSLFSWAHVAKHSTLKVGGIYERFANGEVHALLRYFGTENALLPLSEQNFTRCSFFFFAKQPLLTWKTQNISFAAQTVQCTCSPAWFRRTLWPENVQRGVPWPRVRWFTWYKKFFCSGPHYDTMSHARHLRRR